MVATPSKKRDELLSEEMNDQDDFSTPIFLQQQAMYYGTSVVEEVDSKSGSHANQSEVGVNKSPMDSQTGGTINPTVTNIAEVAEEQKVVVPNVTNQKYVLGDDKANCQDDQFDLALHENSQESLEEANEVLFSSQLAAL